MTRFNKWLPAALALAGFALVGTPRGALATPTLELQATIATFGGGTITAHAYDNDFMPPVPASNTDLNPLLGTLTVGSAVTPVSIPVPGGHLLVYVSTSTSNAQASGLLANPSQFTSGSQSVQNNSPHPVTITLQISDINFMQPPSPVFFTATAGGTITPLPGHTSVAGASALATSYADASNAYFGTGTPVETTSPGTFTPTSGTPRLFSYTGFGTAPFTYSGGYSQTLELVFKLPAFTQLLGRQNAQVGTQAVPEPGTMAMAFAGLPMLGVIAWRWRKRDKAAA